jgi:hypothetical protein
MRPFSLGCEYNSPVLYIRVERIPSTNIESTPKRARKNHLSLAGNFGLHGKTILPLCRAYGNSGDVF